MNTKKRVTLKITSPTFHGRSQIFEKVGVNRLKKIFIKKYSQKEADYIDKIFRSFYNKLLDISDKETKRVLEEFRISISTFVYSEVMKRLIMSGEIRKDKEFRFSLIQDCTKTLFFFADMLIITIANDYKGIKKYKTYIEEKLEKFPISYKDEDKLDIKIKAELKEKLRPIKLFERFINRKKGYLKLIGEALHPIYRKYYMYFSNKRMFIYKYSDFIMEYLKLSKKEFSIPSFERYV